MFAFIVLNLVFSTKPTDLLGSPKWSILCWVGRETLMQSISQAVLLLVLFLRTRWKIWKTCYFIAFQDSPGIFVKFILINARWTEVNTASVLNSPLQAAHHKGLIHSSLNPFELYKFGKILGVTW